MSALFKNCVQSTRVNFERTAALYPNLSRASVASRSALSFISSP
jgi:hypothetical protein